MRDFKGMKRQRGRNRKPGGNQSNSANPNRSWDSQGPENIKVRGNAQTVYERYQQLARDASSSSDRVLAENYLQHAEHYFRVLRALQPQRSFQEIAQREQIGQGFDIDFEDESGAQAAAFAAAQQAADRQAQPQQNPQQQPQQPNQGQDATQNQADSDGDGNGRRETRRERWERRRDGRRGPYERDESEGGAAQSDQARDENTASGQETPASGGDTSEQQDRPRRARRPRSGGDENEGSSEIESSLPGFLTRATPQPAGDTASETSAEDKPAPRRRAPRRKAADTPVGGDV
jgi:hypothetical protein